MLGALIAVGIVTAPHLEARPSTAVREPAAAKPSARTSFPLTTVPGKRYLVDAAGKPFLINGDAAWSLMVQVKNEGVDRYLADRRRKGFNTILVNLLEHKWAAAAPDNAYGEAPFRRAGDFSTPNERYFRHVDAVLRKARSRGILVLLVPMYAGFQGGSEGWWSEMKSNGAAKLREFGRFVGLRYRSFDNVLWVASGDFDPPKEDRQLVEAVAEGIASVDSSLQTYHGGRGTSALAYWSSRPSWLDVNTIYTDETNVVERARTEYRRSTIPFFLIEARYENEGVIKPIVVRRQAYQAILAGADGSLMGNRPIWEFSPGWTSSLDSPGARGMKHVGELFRSLPWWRLRPDFGHRLLTGGAGEAPLEAVAARTDDRSYAVVYTPSARKLTIDLSRLRGRSVEARWYDPTSGRYRRVGRSPFPARGSRSFVSPSRNAAGDGDFVLLLQARKS